jgi:DNA-binding CsgD family transcriptional regulator
MHQYRFNPPTADLRSCAPMDDFLWKKIHEVVGGFARFRNAVMIEGRGPQEPIMVVVVERGGLPGNEDLRRRFDLTPRESDVARHMADRMSNEEIARRLGISVHTVRRHCERVLCKLKIRTRNEARSALLDPIHVPPRRYGRSVT